MNFKNYIKSFFKEKQNIFILFFSLFGAIVLFPNIFEANIYPLAVTENEPWKSLDPSWLITLNYASLNNLTWGQDIIFTYGPLSYLSTRVGWGHNSTSFLFYDLFFFINYLCIFYISLKNSKNIVATLLTALVLLLLYPIWLGSSNAIVLMAFLVFWIRKSIDNPHYLYYVFQIIILTLVFYIKFNTGLIAFPLFFTGIGYHILNEKSNYKKFLFIAIIPLLLLFGISFLLNVNLISYVKSGIQIISGYNDVMYWEHELQNRVLAIIILVFSFSFFIYKIIIEKKQNWLKRTTIFFIFGIPMFVLYKQGFVRGMEMDFFILVPLLLFVIQDIHQIKFNYYTTILLLVCLSISTYYVYDKDKSAFDIKSKFEMNYFEGYKKFTSTSGLYLYPNNNQLPDSVKEKIGKSTVDVFPWNSQMLIENKLNYSPRPVIQAYTAYTPKLEDLNYEFYNSEKAPEFVIYDFTSVDYRYPFFDEIKLQLIFKKNYEIAEFFDYNNRKTILLKKKKDFKPLSFVKSKEYAIYMDSPLVPQKDIYYQLEAYSTLKGNITSIVKYAPEIQIDILGNNTYSFRTSKNLMAIGIYSNDYILNTEGYKNYLENTDSKDIEKVRYYKFRPLNLSMFKEKIKVTEYKITQK